MALTRSRLVSGHLALVIATAHVYVYEQLIMVCKKCEKKLSKLAAPDPFTSSSSSIKDGSRKVGENKLLGRPGSSKNRFQPYQSKCRDCKQPTTQNSAKYCHGCAYRKGLCSICGKKILDTSSYVMSNK